MRTEDNRPTVGARGHINDERADQFSYCVALYEGLYRERPFAGETVGEVQRAIERGELRRAPHGSGVPARLRRVVLRGLRAAPAGRFESMDALIAALERSRRPTWRSATAAAVAAMAVLAAGAPLWPRIVGKGGAAGIASSAQVDDEIRSVLAQMDAESDLGKVAILDRRLDQLIADARHARDELRKRGAAPPESPSSTGSQLDADISQLLKKFGAETYVVPPIFKERLRHHVDRIRQAADLRLIYRRKNKYWPIISRELTALGLPEELGYVVWTESRFDPVARSTTGSVGLWQFEAQTARHYGLRVDAEVDERADVHKSTRAAARCLAERLAELGTDSFMLALASYNSGQNKMRRTLQQLAQEPGGFGKNKRDFWYLYRRKLLPDETREYVPKVLAAALIGTHPQRYGLE